MGNIADVLKKIEPDRSNLIKALQAVQEVEEYLSDAAIEEIARHFAVAPVEVEGIVSFYAQFKRVKPGKYRISVCDGTACHIKGAPLVAGWITEELGIAAGETDKEGLFSLEVVACLGCCSLAPVIAINGTVYGNLDRKALLKILRDYRKKGGAA